MKQFITFSLLLFVLDISSGALKPDCKNWKQFTHDSFVCVCSEAHPCDKIVGPVKTGAGVVTRWESQRDGARLRKQTFHFGKYYNQSLPYASTGELHVKVNRDVKYQEIFGFGGAFSDAAAINMRKLGPKLEDQMVRDYFSRDGLEYSIGRVTIAGSDFSTRAYTYDDHDGDKSLSKWNLTAEDYNFKIPIIQKAQAMAPHGLKLFGSPWSGPAWMKTNKKLTNGGSLIGPVGSEYWQIYAKYLVKYLDAYKAHNITHWGLTIQNEPLGDFGFNTMHYTAEMERDFLVKNLGPELQRSGYGTDKLKVMVWDFNLNHMVDYVKTIYADKTALKYLAGTAVHWYDKLSKTLLDQVHNLSPDKFILATEACHGLSRGSWGLAQSYAEDVLQDLLHHVVGWTDWNLALDIQGGPNWSHNYNDAPMIVDEVHKEYYRQPHFYALAHFSKFLPPGSVRIDSKIISQKNTKAIIGAFRTKQNSTVAVVVNNHDETVQLTVEDTKFGKIILSVDPHSIQTYVYYD